MKHRDRMAFLIVAALSATAITSCSAEQADEELSAPSREQSLYAPPTAQWGPVAISVLGPTGGAPWKVLDILDGPAYGAAAQIWTMRSGASEQQWRVYQQVELLTYMFQNVRSGYCLEEGLSGVVYQAPCTDEGSQKWWYDGDHNGWGMLHNQRTGLCLDVVGGSFRDGARLQGWPCNNAWNQRWNIW
jgi:hypothetical protein